MRDYMAKSWTGPIVDNHFHLNRNGRFLDAVADFSRVGGTGLVLVHCPNFASPPKGFEAHKESYLDTISMAELVDKKFGLEMRVVLGPHPAAFAHELENALQSQDGEAQENALSNYWDSIEAALELVKQGRANAIGEVGRPHWKVSDEVWDLSNQLLKKTMKIANENNVSLQLHVEGESDETYPELALFADQVGLDRSKLIRHYAPANVSDKNTHGIIPSVLCGKGSVEEIITSHDSNSTGFFMETDYMDDLKRPGAVLGPKTVPKRVKQLFEMGISEEILFSSHQDLLVKAYGQPLEF